MIQNSVFYGAFLTISYIQPLQNAVDVRDKIAGLPVTPRKYGLFARVMITSSAQTTEGLIKGNFTKICFLFAEGSLITRRSFNGRGKRCI